LTRGRHAGVVLPLFSASSSKSWGIGEIGDLVPMGRWLSRAGFDAWLLLPLNEMSPGQHSPYAAMTAMAIDPIYLSLEAIDDFAALGGASSLGADDRAILEEVRAAPAIRYDAVRDLKVRALGRAFDRFEQEDVASRTGRAAGFNDFVAAQAWWLEDFALFRALHVHHGERPWWEWDEGIRQRRPEEVKRARGALSREVRFNQYVQWQADLQWRRARSEAGVAMFGDLPFMVGADSADVWARQEAFRFDATIGVPPDAFSATGQDWGLPMFRWDVIAQDDFEWIRQRARRNADLYRGFRIDHLVGLYRTFAIPVDGGERWFSPPDQPSQVKQGETLLRLFIETGARVIAEDLGTVPDFVRASITKLRVPGYKVLRWEREWGVDGHPFRDPAAYPPLSVATTGTHDTETLAEWWEEASEEERRAFLHIPAMASRRIDPRRAAFGAPELAAMLDAMYASGSDLLVLPIQDVFGWRDRINTPATVGRDNWSWRMPWPVDQWLSQPEAVAAADRLRELASRHGRLRVKHDHAAHR
jgi:4-alpha-glucanotransferase